MSRNVRIFFGSIGFLIVALLIDAINAGDALAQQVKSQLVEIINTPDKPVPIAGNVRIDTTQNTVKVDASATNPLPVAGTVNLNANSSVGINPAQNTVKLDAANPLNVRDLNSRIVPWQGSYQVIIPNGHGNKTSDFQLSLPAGKRLVIQQVSARVGLAKNDDGGGANYAAGYLSTTTNGSWGDHPILFTPTMNYWNSRSYSATQQMQLFADSGTTLRLYFERDNYKNEADFRVSISSYLIDVQ